MASGGRPARPRPHRPATLSRWQGRPPGGPHGARPGWPGPWRIEGFQGPSRSHQLAARWAQGSVCETSGRTAVPKASVMTGRFSLAIGTRGVRGVGPPWSFMAGHFLLPPRAGPCLGRARDAIWCAEGGFRQSAARGLSCQRCFRPSSGATGDVAARRSVPGRATELGLRGDWNRKFLPKWEHSYSAGAKVSRLLPDEC